MGSPSRGAKPSRWSASLASFSVARFQRGTYTNEDRPCVGRQRCIEMRGERFAIESGTVLENDGPHPGTAFAPWHLHAVHAGGGDAWAPHELLLHLGCRHVLALVAKGVAEAIHEEQV